MTWRAPNLFGQLFHKILLCKKEEGRPTCDGSQPTPQRPETTYSDRRRDEDFGPFPELRIVARSSSVVCSMSSYASGDMDDEDDEDDESKVVSRSVYDGG